MLASSIAAVFVVLWSTGFVVARAITPYGADGPGRLGWFIAYLRKPDYH
jgi:hypothetical protein